MFLLTLLSACSGVNTSTGEYRIDNVRIFRDTPVWELAQAVRSQNSRRIARLATENSEFINYQDPLFGTTLLHWAVGTERFNSAEALLIAGADPNIISTWDGGTALYLAAGSSWVDNSGNRDPRFVLLLLEFGADPNIAFVGNHNTTPEVGTTPLMRSIGSGIDKTKALIEWGADINAITESGNTAVMQALRHVGSTSMLERLEYAYFLIVEMQADITIGYYQIVSAGAGISDRDRYPVDVLRYWIFPLDCERHEIKMKIVDEFTRQGVDYWSTEIHPHQIEIIQRRFPGTWEEYLNKY